MEQFKNRSRRKFSVMASFVGVEPSDTKYEEPIDIVEAVAAVERAMGLQKAPGQSISASVSTRQSMIERPVIEVNTNAVEIPDVNKEWIKPKHIHTTPLKHNYLCELCNRGELKSSKLLKCAYCNVVCHDLCLTSNGKKIDLNEEGHYICFHCEESLHECKKVFVDTKDKAVALKSQVLAQIMISKYLRRHKQRKFYKNIRDVIMKMQTQFRIRHRTRQFLVQRQSKMRVMHININTCVDTYPADRVMELASAGTRSAKKEKELQFYVSVTVMEMSQYGNRQTWRFLTDIANVPNKKSAIQNIDFKSTILIPGVSGFQYIVLTVFQKLQSKDLFVGQTTVFLAEDHIWKRGGNFKRKLNDYEVALRNPSTGLDLKAESRCDITGTLSFELVPCHKMSAECGTVFGTNVVDVIRAMQVLPRFVGYTQADGSEFVKSSGVSPKSAAAPAAGAINFGSGGSVSGKGNNNNSNSSDNSSVVSSTSTAALLASNSAVAPVWSIPHRKMWIAILGGKIYVYPHFGDQLKLVVHMDCFTASTVKKNEAVVYRLERQGYPGFSFTSQTPEDSLRWKCAFITSTGSQQFTKDKFDMNLLINDIAKMEKELAPQRSTKVANVFFNALKRTSTAGASQFAQQYSPSLTRQSTRSSLNSADFPSDLQLPPDKWDGLMNDDQLPSGTASEGPSRPATSQKASLFRGNSVVLTPVSSLPSSTSSSVQSTPTSIKMLSATAGSPSRGNLLAPLSSDDFINSNSGSGGGGGGGGGGVAGSNKSPLEKSPKTRSRKGGGNQSKPPGSSGRDIPPIGNRKTPSLRFSVAEEGDDW